MEKKRKKPNRSGIPKAGIRRLASQMGVARMTEKSIEVLKNYAESLLEDLFKKSALLATSGLPPRTTIKRRDLVQLMNIEGRKKYYAIQEDSEYYLIIPDSKSIREKKIKTSKYYNLYISPGSFARQMKLIDTELPYTTRVAKQFRLALQYVIEQKLAEIISVALSLTKEIKNTKTLDSKVIEFVIDNKCNMS